MPRPDAPAEAWHRCALFDVPASLDKLEEGIPTLETLGVIRQALNDFGGYGGPCPPRGHGLHHYHFRLLALGVGLGRIVDARQIAEFWDEA